MLSLGKMGKGAAGVAYYSKYPSKGDALGDEIEGRVYQNAASRALGLGRAITTDQVEQLMLGRFNDQDLVQGAGDNHRCGIDATLSAPKSVSVLKSAAELSGDNAFASRIQQAHDNAVTKALQLIQRDCIQSRTGKAGSEGMVKGSMVAASYAHQTSRLGDPQMHTHNIIMNTVLGDDGNWRTLSNEKLFTGKMRLGAAYRAELAANLKSLGCGIEADGSSFKVAGVHASAVTQFSKRRTELEALAEEYGHTGARLMEKLALNSRGTKDHRLTMDEIRASWTTQIDELELTPDAILDAARQAGLDAPDLHLIARDAVLESLTAQDATFFMKDLQTQAFVICSHLGIGADQAEQVAQELAADDEILSLGRGKFTTRTMLAMEVATLDWAREAAKGSHFQLDAETIEEAVQTMTLTSQQATALRRLAGGEGVALLEGMAGTGKSYLMKAYREVAEAAGFTVRGMALAGKAASGLEDGAGIQSSTIHRTLIDLDSGKLKLTDRDIIVIDEAAMADNTLLARVAEHCRESGAKVILLGDARQLQAVGAGGMFDQLTSEIGSASLTEIWRQKSEQDIQSVHNFADGEAGQALQYYKENDRLHIADTSKDALTAMVVKWSADGAEMPDKLMIAGRRADVAELNTLARTAMADTLGRNHAFQSKEGIIQLAVNDRILFKKNDKNLGVMNGQTASITHAKHDKLSGKTTFTAELDTGDSVTFTSDEYDEVRHGYAVTAHASQGDTKTAAYIYASKFMSTEMAYVMASRHKENAEIFASDEEFLDFGNASHTSSLTTEQKLEFVMSQSNKKQTALQIMEHHGYGIADVLEGRCTVNQLGDDMHAGQAGGGVTQDEGEGVNTSRIM
ncbi:MobF family relaxase [Mariprofundus ferrooxydans]|uniref:MobF family relaxase n=1 Tax=Mariprofundus ferrooxydans TaxID=314344 RepID=UPI00143215CD|nr:MobF family relaxase [Mariprofundus ferrooxydans]